MLNLHILCSRKTKDDNDNTVDENYDECVDDYGVLLVMTMMVMMIMTTLLW